MKILNYHIWYVRWPDRHGAVAKPGGRRAHGPGSTLLELDRIAAATNSDIGHLQIDKWKGGWKTGFTTSTSHRTQAGQSAQSLTRNLKTLCPI